MKIGMMSPGQMGLYEGLAVEISSLENDLLFHGRIATVYDDAIDVVDLRGRPLPSVIYNTELKLKVYFREFRTAVYYAQVKGSSDVFWRLDEIVMITEEDRREYFRLKVSVPCKARSLDRKEGDARFTPCTIEDISANGLLIYSKEPYEQDEVILCADACLLGSEEPFSFQCEVRRVIEQCRYGCHFVDLRDDDRSRLVKTIFQLQHSMRS